MNVTPQDKLFICGYILENFHIAKGEDRLTLKPSNVLSVDYINDYDMHICSILKVVVRLDLRQKLYILQNKRDIRVHMELLQRDGDIEIETWTSSPKIVFNCEFACYFSDDDENLDLDLLAARIKQNESGVATKYDLNEENLLESENDMEFYLFDAKLLAASRYVYNKVFQETTLNNIIGQMLTESNHRKVVMSKIENPTVYKELIIPPMPVFKALIYLDEKFGLYEKGATIFYDLDTCYILNLKDEVTAWRPGEWKYTNFMIPPLDSSIPGDGMRKIPDQDQFFCSATDLEVRHQRSGSLGNASRGADMKIVSVDKNVLDILQSDSEYIESKNQSIMHIKSENIYAKSVIKARQEENEGIVYISAAQLDISAFAPNKLYRLIYEDPTKAKKYNSNLYRLAYTNHSIRLASEEYADSSHHIVLKKVRSQESSTSENE